MRDIGWRHILLEGFCLRSNLKPGKYVYEVISTNPFKTIKKPSPYYDKDKKYKTPKKPKYCKNKVCYDCFGNDCPYLGIAEPSKDEDIKIMKMIDKMNEKED